MENSSYFRGKNQEILLFPDCPAPLYSSPWPLPRAEDWLRQSPVGSSEEHNLLVLQPGWEPSRAVATVPVPHSQEELSPTHTKALALRRELGCREHAVLSKPITSDTSRAGTCPPGSSPLCSCVQPAMLCNRAQEQQGIFLSTDLSTVIVPVCTRLQTCIQFTRAQTLLLRWPPSAQFFRGSMPSVQPVPSCHQLFPSLLNLSHIGIADRFFVDNILEQCSGLVDHLNKSSTLLSGRNVFPGVQ